MNPSQVAFNPLTWYFTEHGFDPGQAPPLPEIYRQIREAGFTAVHAEKPGDVSIEDYRQLLDDSGLRPAPGYFQASFGGDGLDEILENARRVAGEHAALGLSHIFIAESFGAQPRTVHPAAGAGFDPDRLERIVQGLGTVSAAMAAEGVMPCLHPHVGTWIETEAETIAVLERIDARALLFGPDTGHLSWAGADPVSMIERYRDRIGAVHLKDVRDDVRHAASTGGLDYLGTVSRHVWTEPGRGAVDFKGVLAALDGFDGWFVVEVDLADQPTPQESAAVSARWVDQAFGGPDSAP